MIGCRTTIAKLTDSSRLSDVVGRGADPGVGQMLKYKCLLCGIEWGDPQATEAEISHGYCPVCIRKRYTARIHQAQMRAGYSDCFNRGYNDCSEVSCCFRMACQDDSVVSWRKRLLESVDVQEIDPCG